MEFRRLVMLPRTALDVFLFGEETLELRICFLDERRGLDLCVTGRLGAAAGGGRRHDLARGLTRRLADGHRGLAADLVLERRLVREDVALVDPHLDADATGGGAGLAEAVVGVGPGRVQRHAGLPVPLRGAPLGAPPAAGGLHPNALRTGLL